MKKFFAIVTIALAFAACAKQGLEPSAEPAFGERLTAHIGGPASKVSFDASSGKFAWGDPDRIALFTSAGSYQSVEVQASGVFTFVPEGGAVRAGYAFYPADVASGSADAPAVSLPASYQIAPEGMGDEYPTPMIAVNDPASDDLWFYHLGGSLRLTLNGVPAGTASLEVRTGRGITGTFSVADPSSNTPTIASSDTEDALAFILSAPLAENADGLVLNIPLPTGTYSKLEVTALDASSAILLQVTDNTERTFPRGRARKATLDMLESEAPMIESPLTLEALEDGTKVTIANSAGLPVFQYSKDKQTWITAGGEGVSSVTISLNAGQCVYLRGDNATYCTNIEKPTTIRPDKACYIYGNIMSLLDSDNFKNCTEITGSFAFYGMFSSANIQNHPTEELLLPATKLAGYCYGSMFSGCTSLVTAPELPATAVDVYCYGSMFSGCTSLATAPELLATALANSCYSSMFSGCTSLATAPELPATAVAQNCYGSMFSRCTSLVTAPELPATTLDIYCYDNMFSGCTSLVTTPALPATILARNCYSNMFFGCTSLVTAPELPAMTLADACYGSMFMDCTSLVTAPELPATSLAGGCYGSMFRGCTNLTTAPELPATTSAQDCYFSMFWGCTNLTTAPELPATTLAQNCYYSMFGRCTSLTTAPELPALSLAAGCYMSMFSGCRNLTTAPELPATTLADGCYYGMFFGCTGLVTAPELPATTLAQKCYYSMFSECTGLVTAPELPATTLDKYCYNSMFSGCRNLTTAPELPATTLDGYCYANMFSGCTSLTVAPELPATTLVEWCYNGMFSGCSNLNYVKCLATEIPSDQACTASWLSGVSPNGTFVKDASMTSWETGHSGIPAGWTVEDAN